jgi:hypothetical protein
MLSTIHAIVEHTVTNINIFLAKAIRFDIIFGDDYFNLIGIHYFSQKYEVTM